MKELSLLERRKFGNEADGNGTREVSRISSIRITLEVCNPFANGAGKEESRNRRGDSLFRFMLDRQRELRFRTDRRK